MFGIIEHFTALCLEIGYGLCNHGKIFFPGIIHNVNYMQVPGFAENRYHRRT